MKTISEMRKRSGVRRGTPTWRESNRAMARGMNDEGLLPFRYSEQMTDAELDRALMPILIGGRVYTVETDDEWERVRGLPGYIGSFLTCACCADRGPQRGLVGPGHLEASVIQSVVLPRATGPARRTRRRKGLRND